MTHVTLPVRLTTALLAFDPFASIPAGSAGQLPSLAEALTVYADR